MKRTRYVVRAILILLVCYFGVGIALLPVEKITGKECLPSDLARQDHNDYPRYVRWVPRRATSWCMVEPPLLIAGSQSNARQANGELGPSPLPPPGEWQFSVVTVRKGWPFVLPYIAVTTKTSFHARIGVRWNPDEGYYTFPSVTVKQLKK